MGVGVKEFGLDGDVVGVGIKEFGFGGDVVGACGYIGVCAWGVVTEDEEEEDVVWGDDKTAGFNLSMETN